MFRFCAILWLLCGFSACGMAQVLDLPVREAAGRLKRGDIGFILEAPPARMGELARINPQAPFYAGLLVRSSGVEDAEERALALFQAALDSPSSRVRDEAAGELILPLLEGKIPPEPFLAALQKKKPSSPLPALGEGPPLGGYERSVRGAALYRLGRYGEIEALYAEGGPGNSWDKALGALAGGGAWQALGPFFFAGTPDAAYRWALEEGRRQEALPLGGAGEAAVEGRLATARSSFGEALRYFKAALEQDRGLFLRYPDLTGDLGRAFQFAGAGDEGIRLFLEWEGELEKAGRGEKDPLGYRLLYYAARMARQLGRHEQGVELFVRALAHAPDSIQADACIWYILSGTLASRPENAAARIKEYIPRWHDGSYFTDVLDLLCRYLTARRQWKSLGEIFSLLYRRDDGAGAAKYAWILGRALEEGYILPVEGAIILGISSGPPDRAETARAFFKVAFEEGTASFYYRALGASRLGEAAAVVPAEAGDGKSQPPSEDLAFLLGFFEYGGADLVPPRLPPFTESLPVRELRAVAEALAGAGQWAESIRLVNNYMARPDYEMARRDLELNYPRPYAELIEENARAASLAPELLYGLIRTESNFMPEIVSRAGAEGLSQLMDATAREMAGRIVRQGGPDYLAGDGPDLKDPAVNVHIGAYYLNYLIGRMGSPLLALLAYNGGMGRVQRWRAAERTLPEDLFLETIEYTETREYGRRVLAAAAAYGYLYYDMSMEAVIADIFRKD